MKSHSPLAPQYQLHSGRSYSTYLHTAASRMHALVWKDFHFHTLNSHVCRGIWRCTQRHIKLQWNPFWELELYILNIIEWYIGNADNQSSFEMLIIPPTETFIWPPTHPIQIGIIEHTSVCIGSRPLPFLRV